MEKRKTFKQAQKIVNKIDPTLSLSYINKVPLGIRVKITITIIIALLISPTIAVSLNDLIRDLNIIQGNVAVYISTAINLLVVTGIILLSLNIIILKPIKELVTKMQQAGEGDLTALVDIKSRDGMKVLADFLNLMLVNQAKIIDEVRTESNSISKSAEEMASSTEQISSSTQQISAAAQEVSINADHQNNLIIETSQTLLHLASLVQMAKEKAVSANDKSKNAVKIADQGREKVKETVKAMDNISHKTNEAVMAIKI